ncbi:SIR2 family NAD-dependent protein deacylase [Tomitella fengzijianii]|uniref:NAD-dependent protein deacylase n=1 Tax=Tomitella fengzijianii TaxID=2597660 RepID=A0A516X1C9_9ACTN|nr:NAD-dependent deacylase [Tomitella fengzijianii]QDQ96889.1 NAD-dependent deacylase [Tomitella fengzijianii]
MGVTADGATPEICRALISALRSARRVVVLTGAGASAESGIPTFRDALTGLWERFDPARLATPEAFAADPDLVWGWYAWRRDQLARCRPNPAHDAVARLQRAVRARGGTVTVVTQNVDDLHERAGTQDVVHLHGSIAQSRCAMCGETAEPGQAGADAALSAGSDGAGEGKRIPPPLCVGCGGRLRPSVVWFGEELPVSAWLRAQNAAEGADVLMSVGTSSTVYPAAELPHIAGRAGARIVQVNPSPTGLEPIVHDDFRASAGEVLPALVDAAFGR